MENTAAGICLAAALVGAGCASAQAPSQVKAPLENTYWKLVQLGDAAVAGVHGSREPHVILHPDSRRVTGSGGCNRLTGSYELMGDQLSFERMAATMMACQDGMDTEQAFLEALKQVHKTRITRQQLELLDAAGNGVARFEAVYLK